MNINDKKSQLTPEQEAAIRYRGGALLVSAAAGSGKTKVLVERLLSHIEQGDNINDFLVITYTRAAAAELRERILDEISDRLAADPRNRRLRKQALLCRSAQINTIHAFCTDILREYGHLAMLPPDFRVADESESELIKAEVLEDLLDNAYETINESEEFKALVDTMSAGRDDRRLSEIILDAHSKLQSSPDRSAWVEEQITKTAMQGVTDIYETIWGAYLLARVRAAAEYWYKKMAEVRGRMEELPELNKAYGDSMDVTVSGLEAFCASLGEGWDEARKHAAVEFPRPMGGGVSGYDEFKDIRKRCKEALDDCDETLECSSEEHIEDMQAVAPVVSKLLRLVLEFDEMYSAEKRRRGVADFSDLEHITLSLLIDKEGDAPETESGNLCRKSSLSDVISRRYKEIMVDEYQDVNVIQEMIFNAISGDGKNIFMVGDVKQSIYRFRLADPSIFLKKYRSYADATYCVDRNASSNVAAGVNDGASVGTSPDPVLRGSSEAGSPAKILLSKNFRSRKGILDTVNFIFERIMSVEFGEMDYTRQERLTAGREDNENDCDNENSAVEIAIIDISGMEKEEDAEDPDRVREEARYIAERISDLTIGAHMIPDGQGGERCIRYSDVVVLLRSMRGKAWQYAAALSERGIPSDMPGSEGFFETIEISAALSLLTIIDNPMQDIPLAATLRGPIYGFTADDLAEIRAQSRGTDFYRALQKAAESNEKCASFLRETGAMREAAPDMSADRFIHYVYNITGLPGRVGAMRGGDKRRVNLLLLAEYARRFEQSGYKGLFGFLTYIRGLQESGKELERGSDEPEDNAVRIMSIHKSKGLEFPIVFLADTTKRFNNADVIKPLLIHHRLGVGAMRNDKQRRIEYPTIARMAVRKALTSGMLAEELRVLYVAMTRAREKLVIVASYKNAEKELGKLSGLAHFGIEPQALEAVNNMAGWILLPLLSERARKEKTAERAGGSVGEGEEERDGGSVNEGEVSVEDGGELGKETRRRPPYDILLITGKPPLRDILTANTTSSDSNFPVVNADDVQKLRERFSFSYPHPAAPYIPSKLTVTELKGRYLDYEVNEDASEIQAEAVGIPPSKANPDAESAGSGHSANGSSGGVNRRGPLNFAFERPDFITKKTVLTAAERGTALHLAMQYIDFAECSNADNVSSEIRRLAECGLLSGEQADAVNTKKITRFFESEVGKRVISAENVVREFKFSLLYPAERFNPGGGDDKIMLQGVVDCFFEEKGGLVIIDFKTDSVTPGSTDEKVRQYTRQLDAYADALERITGIAVKERIIYFFAIDEGVVL